MAALSTGSALVTSPTYSKEIAGFVVGEGETRRAQQFSTGADAAGYTLGSVELNLREASGAGSVPLVAIHLDSSGEPGTLLGVLGNPADPFGATSLEAGNRTFTAASALSLAANTNYWLVLKDTKSTAGEEHYTASTANSEDETGAEGFGIANGHVVWTEADDWGTANTGIVRMEIRGTVKEEMTDGDPPAPTLSVADAAGIEGGDVTFTATLSATTTAVVTATWTASIGTSDTAVAADLGTTKTGTVTVTAGQQSGTFDVPTAADTTNEADETFTVTLSSVSTNATLAADPTATGTIDNDDAPAAPTDFQAGVGDTEVELSWDAPASDANITRHEFRYKEGAGSYPASFTEIPTSAPGGANAKSYTVTGLTNEVAHTFELQAVNDAGNGTAVEAGPVTPTPGICGRTQKVYESIVYFLGEGGVTRTCAEVNVAPGEFRKGPGPVERWHRLAEGGRLRGVDESGIPYALL